MFTDFWKCACFMEIWNLLCLHNCNVHSHYASSNRVQVQENFKFCLLIGHILIYISKELLWILHTTKRKSANSPFRRTNQKILRYGIINFFLFKIFSLTHSLGPTLIHLLILTLKGLRKASGPVRVMTPTGPVFFAPKRCFTWH